MTSGASDDRNPTLNPDTSQPVIAFDSNRSNANGSATKANRDVWVMDANHPNASAVQVTNFLTSENIQPSWSTNKLDQPGGGNRWRLFRDGLRLWPLCLGGGARRHRLLGGWRDLEGREPGADRHVARSHFWRR